MSVGRRAAAALIGCLDTLAATTGFAQALKRKPPTLFPVRQNNKWGRIAGITSGSPRSERAAISWNPTPRAAELTDELSVIVGRIPNL